MNATIRCPTTGRHIDRSAALLDSGSDCTVLPSSVVSTLDLALVELQECEDFHGVIVVRPIFLVAVSIHSLPPVEVQAVLEERQKYVLLGRDVLNNYRIVHNGPQLTLEIG